MHNLPDRFLGLCVVLLLGALMLHWAIGLLLEIWVPLAVITGVGVLLAGAVAWLRGRSSGW